MRQKAIVGGFMLLLTACGSNAADGGQQSGGAASNASGVAAEANSPAPVAAAAAPDARATPGELKTFRDWTVGCDNVGACKAAALAPEGEEFPAVLMSITRAAGPDGALTLAFLSSEAIPLPLRIAVDRAPAGEGGRTDDDATRIEGALAQRIVAAAANGKSLSVADGGNASTSIISLAGLSAALRYIDEKQGRAGTQGALVARGTAPDTRPAPAAPVVTALAAGGKAAALPSAAQLAELRKGGSCDDGVAGNGALPPETHALGGGKTLLLLPCWAGAYNVSSLVLVGDGGGFKPAEFDSPTGLGEEGGPPMVVNGGWEDGLLGSYSKGRGLGDCGVTATYAWDGKRFRLVEQAAMGECRGNIDYIRTWLAEVRRG